VEAGHVLELVAVEIYHSASGPGLWHPGPGGVFEGPLFFQRRFFHCRVTLENRWTGPLPCIWVSLPGFEKKEMNSNLVQTARQQDKSSGTTM
jgi:hypothetical protein